MRIKNPEQLWSRLCLLFFAIFLGALALQFNSPAYLRHGEAELLIVMLQSQNPVARLAAAPRFSSICWSLISPTIDHDSIDRMLYEKLVSEAESLLVYAKTDAEKAAALNFCYGVPGVGYAARLANESMVSENPELLNAAIPYAYGDAYGERSDFGRRLCDIATHHWQCQSAVLHRVNQIYNKKGLPWGDTPDGDLLELANKLKDSWNPAVRWEAEELVRLSVYE